MIKYTIFNMKKPSSVKPLKEVRKMPAAWIGARWQTRKFSKISCRFMTSWARRVMVAALSLFQTIGSSIKTSLLSSTRRHKIWKNSSRKSLYLKIKRWAKRRTELTYDRSKTSKRWWIKGIVAPRSVDRQVHSWTMHLISTMWRLKMCLRSMKGSRLHRIKKAHSSLMIPMSRKKQLLSTLETLLGQKFHRTKSPKQMDN